MHTRKHKRRQLLHQIDVLEPERCEVCKEGSANLSAVLWCTCDAAAEIRELGIQYQALTRTTKTERLERLFQELETDGLTWELYRRFKEDEVMDKDIAHRLGRSVSWIYFWKNRSMEGEEQ